jgi:hypothetical protein
VPIKFLSGNLEGRARLGGLDIIIRNAEFVLMHTKCGYVDWIHLVQDRT